MLDDVNASISMEEIIKNGNITFMLDGRSKVNSDRIIAVGRHANKIMYAEIETPEFCFEIASRFINKSILNIIKMFFGC